MPSINPSNSISRGRDETSTNKWCAPTSKRIKNLLNLLQKYKNSISGDNREEAFAIYREAFKLAVAIHEKAAPTGPSAINEPKFFEKLGIPVSNESLALVEKSPKAFFRYLFEGTLPSGYASVSVADMKGFADFVSEVLRSLRHGAASMKLRAGLMYIYQGASELTSEDFCDNSLLRAVPALKKFKVGFEILQGELSQRDLNLLKNSPRLKKGQPFLNDNNSICEIISGDLQKLKFIIDNKQGLKANTNGLKVNYDYYENLGLLVSDLFMDLGLDPKLWQENKFLKEKFLDYSLDNETSEAPILLNRPKVEQSKSSAAQAWLLNSPSNSNIQEEMLKNFYLLLERDLYGLSQEEQIKIIKDFLVELNKQIGFPLEEAEENGSQLTNVIKSMIDAPKNSEKSEICEKYEHRNKIRVINSILWDDELEAIKSSLELLEHKLSSPGLLKAEDLEEKKLEQKQLNQKLLKLKQKRSKQGTPQQKKYSDTQKISMLVFLACRNNNVKKYKKALTEVRKNLQTKLELKPNDKNLLEQSMIVEEVEKTLKSKWLPILLRRFAPFLLLLSPYLYSALDGADVMAKLFNFINEIIEFRKLTSPSDVKSGGSKKIIVNNQKRQIRGENSRAVDPETNVGFDKLQKGDNISLYSGNTRIGNLLYLNDRFCVWKMYDSDGTTLQMTGTKEELLSTISELYENLDYVKHKARDLKIPSNKKINLYELDSKKGEPKKLLARIIALSKGRYIFRVVGDDTGKKTPDREFIKEAELLKILSFYHKEYQDFINSNPELSNTSNQPANSTKRKDRGKDDTKGSDYLRKFMKEAQKRTWDWATRRK